MLEHEQTDTAGGGGLAVRGQIIIDAAELSSLQAAVGDDLLASATIRAWLAGEELPPHSVAVALETQLRMMFEEPAEACALLSTLLDRLAEAFPAEVQPLET